MVEKAAPSPLDPIKVEIFYIVHPKLNTCLTLTENELSLQQMKEKN